MTQHTKGPWQYGEDGYGNGYDVVANGRHIVSCAEEANALRIVACVNACEGLDDEIFERGFTVRGQAMASARVKAQRDELLDALQQIMAGISGCEKEAKYEAARAAIAKATGGAA